MTDRPTDLSSLPSYQAPRRSLFSARKFALDGLGRRRPRRRRLWLQPVAGSGRYLHQPAHAQVNNEVRKVAQPIGFADIVERVKPSVISVKVNINEKVAQGRQRQQRRLAVPAGLADGALLPPLRRTGWLAARHARWTARRPRRGDRPGFRLLHLGRRLCRDQQPRGRRRRQGRSHDRRRQDLHGQGDRHRSRAPTSR